MASADETPAQPDAMRCDVCGSTEPHGPHDARPAVDAGRADEALDLDAVRRVIHAATDEPWAIWPDLRDHGLIAIGNAAGVIPEGEIWTDGEAETIAHAYTEEDAELIAQAPTLLKSLVAEVERLRTELADLHGAARASYDLRLEYAAERDRARAELAEVTRERDATRDDLADMAGYRDAAVRQRDEARGEAVDGGEWQWGVRWRSHTATPADVAWTEWAGTEQGAREYLARFAPGVAILVRRSIGPVEVVGDDGSGT